jgi:hypothetical protein
MDPVINLGLAQTKMQSQECLEFIGLFIREDEKEFILHGGLFGVCATSGFASPLLSFDGLVLVGGLIDLAEGNEEVKELLMGQAGNREKLFGFGFEVMVSDHASIILYSQ